MTTAQHPQQVPGRQGAAVLGRVAIFALLWWILTKGSAESWIVGVPVVAASAWLATWLAPPYRWRWRLLGLLHFVPYFVRCTLLGGVDVAWRSLHPQLPIAPDLVEFSLRLPASSARVFFMNVVSLLPGTVSADLHGDVLIVHVIDARQPICEDLRRLERVIASLFGIDIGETTGGAGA